MLRCCHDGSSCFRSSLFRVQRSRQRLLAEVTPEPEEAEGCGVCIVLQDWSTPPVPKIEFEENCARIKVTIKNYYFIADETTGWLPELREGNDPGLLGCR